MTNTTAKDLVNRVVQIGNTSNRDIFDVAGNHVHLIKDGQGEYLSCCCKHCSIHNAERINEGLSQYRCKYKSAVEAFLVMSSKEKIFFKEVEDDEEIE